MTQASTGPVAAVPSLSVFRFDAPTEPSSVVQVPSVCIIAQGAKQITLGEDLFGYDPDHFLLTAIGLPVVARVTRASQAKPYLGLKLELDLGVIARMMVDNHLPQPRPRGANRGMAVGRLTTDMLDAFDRLVALADRPGDAAILAPLITQEIAYLILVSDQGARLRQIATAGTHSQQIARSINWLQANYTQPVKIEDLASQANMSTSAFHQHFRQMTAMTPLQYQKWLRLNEARQLMLSGNADAATASYRVGYGSPSQFSREYRRLFGAPPLQDVESLRQTASR